MEAVAAFDIVDLKSSTGYSCILTSTSKIKCWGVCRYGELGYESLNGFGNESGEMGMNLPYVNVGTGLNVVQFSLGRSTTCVLTSPSYKVKCWGFNNYGQLGQGDKKNRGYQSNQMGDYLPFIDLGTNLPIAQISASSCFTCVLISDGTVRCFGINNRGNLGIGTQTTIGGKPYEMGTNLTKTNLGTGRIVKMLFNGYIAIHTCALLNGDKLKCWGRNNIGQLGYGDTVDRGTSVDQMGDNLPEVDVGTNRKVVQVSVAESHTCAILDDQTTRCWGSNTEGAFATGEKNTIGSTSGTMGNALKPANYGTNRHAIMISSMYYVQCAVLDDNSLKCFGENSAGQLGQGDMIGRGSSLSTIGDNLTAIDLGTNLPITSLSSGYRFNCVVLAYRKIKCFGENYLSRSELGYDDPFGSGKSQVGDEPGEMGTYLPSIDVGQTDAPTITPTKAPTPPTIPTKSPTYNPTRRPTAPSKSPTLSPTKRPTIKPTTPTQIPTSATPSTADSPSTRYPTLSPTTDTSNLESNIMAYSSSIAIGIGVSVPVLLIAGIAVIIYIRNQSKKKKVPLITESVPIATLVVDPGKPMS